MKNNLLFIVLLILIISSCSSIRTIRSEFVKQSKDNSYFRGLVVYNPETDKILINDNGNKYFTPASNTKLFTFYTAYRTFKDSVIGLRYKESKDSLIICGTADPSFLYGLEENRTLDFLKSKKQSIYLLDKNIDEPYYGSGWSWDDYFYDYMPEKNSFPIYGNIINLSKRGDSILALPQFFIKNIRINNEIKLRRDYDKNNFYVNSSAEISKRKIPFKTSNQLVADLLSEEINKKVVLISNRNTNNFKMFYSIRYDSLYKKMLVDSDNFIAEQLMLQVGNKTADSYSVKKAIDYSLKKYFHDIPQKPRWVDGSGLSRYNLFTPESFIYLLTKMYHEIPTKKLFSYFPEGRTFGILKKDYKNQKTNIFAKSGTLSNNYNLSGYLITKQGTLLIFSYMNNHYKGNSIDRKKEMNFFLKKLYLNF